MCFGTCESTVIQEYHLMATVRYHKQTFHVCTVVMPGHSLPPPLMYGTQLKFGSLTPIYCDVQMLGAWTNTGLYLAHKLGF